MGGQTNIEIVSTGIVQTRQQEGPLRHKQD